MKRLVTFSMSLALLLALVSLGAAQTRTPWFHLEVRENKVEPEIVKINLPLSMVDVALKIAQEKQPHMGRIKLSSDEISLPEIRQLWNDLKRAGSAEFVTIEKHHEHVSIARQGNFVVINVAEKDASKVDVRVPIAAVDALLAGTGDELDLKAALISMQQGNIGDVVTVNDRQTQVRLWID